MKYIEKVGDLEKIYEGTPEEIALAKHLIDNELELIYDQEEAVEFILRDLDVKKIGRVEINAVLNADERYMRSVGIIE